VDRAQRWFPRGTRIGHTGTLDPLATGVLVLCIGVATRLTEYVQRMDKVYRSRFVLGARSDTDDADGHIEAVADAPVPNRAEVEQALGGFLGDIEQVPPAYSAAKVAGRRAYDLARRGEQTELGPRRVRVHGIDLLGYEYPRLELEVRCGKGTYIRSLARDLGLRLGCGAYVETLRRTRVGPFAAAEALDLATEAATARTRVLPLSAAVSELASLSLAAEEVAHLRQGKQIPLADDRTLAATAADMGEVAVFGPSGALAGIAVVQESTRHLQPVKVFTD
jgi:tRNA pseudouridine55 synthase